MLVGCGRKLRADWAFLHEDCKVCIVIEGPDLAVVGFRFLEPPGEIAACTHVHVHEQSRA